MRASRSPHRYRGNSIDAETSLSDAKAAVANLFAKSNLSFAPVYA